MANLLISPTEPDAIKALGQTSGVPERHGVDVFWYGQGLRFGIQRKEFPKDFIASLRGSAGRSRFEVELGQMGQLDGGALLVVEGFGTWTTGGELLDDRIRFTKEQMFGVMWAFLFEGVLPIRVRNMDETIEVVRSFHRFSKKDRKGTSLRTRPKPRGPWGTPTNRDWQLHLLQSFDGMGRDRAEAVLEHFGRVPLSWDVTAADLQAVDGLGKVTVGKLMEALPDG